MQDHESAQQFAVREEPGVREQRQEKMARDKRMKTNNNIVDAMHQVSKNMSQRNKPGRERNQVCETMNQHNE